MVSPGNVPLTVISGVSSFAGVTAGVFRTREVGLGGAVKSTVYAALTPEQVEGFPAASMVFA
jgi:hypothetical protein